ATCRLRRDVRGQRAGRVRKGVGPSRRAVAQGLASGSVADRLRRLHLRGGHSGHCDTSHANRDGDPGVGGDSARRRLLLVGASLPGRRPGALVTVAFLAGLRAFSALVFEPLIATNAVTYGSLGTVLIVQSWLIGVGW